MMIIPKSKARVTVLSFLGDHRISKCMYKLNKDENEHVKQR